MPLDLKKPLVIFDLESTGLNTKYDRIVELAAIKLHPGGKQETYHQLINPQRPIPPDVTRIHGIADADVANKPKFEDLAPEIMRFFGSADIGGFGLIRFDIPLLAEEFKRSGFEFSMTDRNVVDAQRIFHQKEPRNLTAALEFYCGKSLDNAHSALADTQATVDVILKQVDHYEDLPKTVDELNEFCSMNHPESVEASGKLRWQGNDVVLNFGQKTGRTLQELASDDPGYLRWILNKNFSQEVKDIVAEALKGRFPTRK